MPHLFMQSQDGAPREPSQRFRPRGHEVAQFGEGDSRGRSRIQIVARSTRSQTLDAFPRASLDPKQTGGDKGLDRVQGSGAQLTPFEVEAGLIGQATVPIVIQIEENQVCAELSGCNAFG